MAKVAIITDTHYGVRNDNLTVQVWQRKFLDDIFFPTLDRYDVRTVLHGGDYGDRRKYINFATARFIEEAYRTPLRQRGITEHVLIGNHDCFLRDSTAINSVDELYRMDTTMRIHAQPTEVDVDGTGILLLPWICGNTRAATEQLIATSSCPLVLGHLELTGFQMYRGVPQHEGMDPKPLSRFARVFSGHFHHPSAHGNITYLGAPYPMVWSDYQDPRGFTLLDTETYETEFIPNPYAMFVRLVYDDEQQTAAYRESLLADVASGRFQDAYVKIVVKTRTQPHWLDEILDALTKCNPQDVLVIDDVQETTTETSDASIDIDTLTLMTEYVNSLAISCDKIALQDYLRTIYHEAVSVASARTH